MKNKKTKDLAIFALFVFPAVAFVLFATDIPFVMNLYYSVFNWNGIGKNMEFVGLANYVKIFTARFFGKVSDLLLNLQYFMLLS